MDTSRAEALSQLSLLTTAYELCDIVHCCRWMSIAIPDVFHRAAPLTQLLDAAYRKSVRRTKRSIGGMPLLTLFWGTTHEKAFCELQNNRRNAVELSYPRADVVICLFTDDLQRDWSSIVTQTDPAQLLISVDYQVHEPLTFLGSYFNDAQRNWSTLEQETHDFF